MVGWLVIASSEAMRERGVWVMRLVRRFAEDESGATVIEYAIVAAFIGVAIVTVMRSVGDEVSAIFDAIAAALV